MGQILTASRAISSVLSKLSKPGGISNLTNVLQPLKNAGILTDSQIAAITGASGLGQLMVSELIYY